MWKKPNSVTKVLNTDIYATMIPIEIQEYEFNEELSYAYKKWQASREYDQRWGATAAAATTATATVRAKKYMM